MAIWQYDFSLLPRTGLASRNGKFPSRIIAAEVDSCTLWAQGQSMGYSGSQIQQLAKGDQGVVTDAALVGK